MSPARRVIRLDEAELEVTQAFERYLAESETAAIRFLNEIKSVTARIRSSPRLYPKISGEFRRALWIDSRMRLSFAKLLTKYRSSPSRTPAVSLSIGANGRSDPRETAAGDTEATAVPIVSSHFAFPPRSSAPVKLATFSTSCFTHHCSNPFASRSTARGSA